jgi:3-dehydroquinate synthase
MSGVTDSKGVSRYSVRLPGGRSYPVVVGKGVSAEAPDHVLPMKAARCVVVTDSNVERSHARPLLDLLHARGIDARHISFQAGEARKSRATKEEIEDRMLAMGCGRDTVLVALGGGVTGDLAGFVAATYMRGVPYIQMPTTLLAMADAAIGGKTGVDHPAGKNLIGAFHHPAAVLADTDFLATLPAGEFRGGLSEIVKAGVIADADLFVELEVLAPTLARGEAGAIAAPLARAVGVKVTVVSADEREEDLRMILNFGHTIAHAIESLSSYEMPHGEAVSIGMAAEAAIAVRLGLLDGGSASRITALLSALGLPVRLPGSAAPFEILAAAGTDKKSRGGEVRFALPRAIGEMARIDGRWSAPVPREAVLSCLEEMRETV